MIFNVVFLLEELIFVLDLICKKMKFLIICLCLILNNNFNMSYSICFETLQLYIDTYKEYTTQSTEPETHLIYVSSNQCIIVKAVDIPTNFWQYHFYRGDMSSSYRFIGYNTNSPAYYPVKKDECTYYTKTYSYGELKKIYTVNKKEEILDYIQKSAEITKIIEQNTTEHNDISMCSSQLEFKYWTDFINTFDRVNPFNKNLTYVCLIMEKVKKIFRDFYHYNFGFFPVYNLMFNNFDHPDHYDFHNHFIAFSHDILKHDKYHYCLDCERDEVKYKYMEKIRITNNMIAKEYLKKRNLYASVIDYVTYIIKHIDIYMDALHPNLINMFKIIRDIMETNNELKFVYIVNILLENFHLLLQTYSEIVLLYAENCEIIIESTDVKIISTHTSKNLCHTREYTMKKIFYSDYFLEIFTKFGKVPNKDLYKNSLAKSFIENILRMVRYDTEFKNSPIEILNFIYNNLNNWFCGTVYANGWKWFGNPYVEEAKEISSYSYGSVRKFHGL